MRFQVINNYATTLSASIGTGDTELVLGTVNELLGAGTDDPIALTIVPAGAQNPDLSQVEIVYVTAVNSSSSSVNVSRGENGTTAKAWDSGAPVECRLPAAVINQFLQAASKTEQQDANSNVSPKGLWLTFDPGTDRGPTNSDATVLGGSGLATQPNALAHGAYTYATGYASHAAGLGTYATETGSHSEGGVGTTASGYASHAEGLGTTASATAGHSEGGSGSEASGYASHAEGINTQAQSEGAHSEGERTNAYGGRGAHAEGIDTVASASAAHAEGDETEASGPYSHAEGKKTVAEGAYSRAGGLGAYALQAYADAQGSYYYSSGGSYYSSSGTISERRWALRQPLTASTSDDTETAMTPGVVLADPAGGPDNEGSAFSFRGRVVASGGGYLAHWTFEAFGGNTGGAGTTIESSSVTKENYTGGASAWSLAIRDANDKLYLDVTGAASTEVSWCALLYGPQINYYQAPAK